MAAVVWSVLVEQAMTTKILQHEKLKTLSSSPSKSFHTGLSIIAYHKPLGEMGWCEHRLWIVLEESCQSYAVTRLESRGSFMEMDVAGSELLTTSHYTCQLACLCPRTRSDLNFSESYTLGPLRTYERYTKVKDIE